MSGLPSGPGGHVLAVVPVRAGVLPAGALEAIAEAGGNALLVGDGLDEAVAAISGHATAVTTWQVGGAPGPAAIAPGLADVVRDIPLVVLPASPDGRDLAPHLAARLGRPLHAGATEIARDRVALARWGGLVLEDVAIDRPVVVTLQPGVRGVGPAQGGAPVIERCALEAPAATEAAGAEVLEVMPPDLATMDLTEAPRIVGGGAGLGSAEAFATLERVALALGASTGATRVVTDAGWVGHERQIGTTGVVVDPRTYLAFGISGAVQHTSGLGAPQHVVSVNLDPHCPMMTLADLAVVADAPAVVDALAARLGVGDGAASREDVGGD